MSALGDVISRLRGVVSTCGQARDDLHQAAGLLDEASAQYGDAIASTRDPCAHDALGLLTHGAAELNDALRSVMALGERVRDYIAVLSGGGTAQAATAAPPRDLIDQLRAELPPPVVPRSGQKTHGRWIGPDGTAHAEISGRDAKYERAIQFFKDMRVSRIPSKASDVEMKLAVHMRVNGIRSVVLLVNHVPCPGPLGCDALIGVILPKGYTLTVYGANGFFREYQGGKTSSWLP
ncbi:DddA-like double-stranded DNA deaminase toxin [Allokutzneria sp. NRRL B-24872]|uniref:DddA-like double-stranded DNA deaminase toxin n=1 Tax=Allokutzneria sp. NRRL B-24872 TaxID=1137961 RepID=UPI00143DFCCD|nr:DddA-like double-stranded DNA deaminase toxin [Allokutzneria sp. NRRL B-24872]